MEKISIFQHFNKVVTDIELNKVLDIIKSEKIKPQVLELRAILKKGDEKEYKKRKKQLPAFTPSGRFEGGRKQEYLINYNKTIILDIDDLKSGVNEVKKKATECNYTYSCFISPGGHGLKILIKTDNSLLKHRECFLEIQAYYENLLNIKIDPSGKDVTRLCFFSYDPDIYINNESKIFKMAPDINTERNIKQLITEIENRKIDITDNYEDWLKIGFAIESEFGESGRQYYHSISKFNPDYNSEVCNEQYSRCIKSNNSGISIATLFHLAKQYGIVIKKEKQSKSSNDQKKEEKTITTNKFTITEKYLKERYTIRYNTVSNKFEYKEKNARKFEDLNENNLFIKLQKNNIAIGINNLIALLKSDFTKKHDPFVEYFKSLPAWDKKTDHIEYLSSFVTAKNQERFNHHFKKWLVRAVKTATEKEIFNKQAFVLVGSKQNSGKSTFCRFLCPGSLSEYIVENIGTDKDSLVAITENFLINLDELSTAEKSEINAFKSMFSKDKVKARLTYDKRASIHIRRASFIGSTDKWEFLTDENGSVRWLCLEIDHIDWDYINKINMDDVYSQAWYYAKNKNFVSELTKEEIEENDRINKKFQVSSPERDLILENFRPSDKDNGNFFTATDILEYLSKKTTLKINHIQIGKELRFLGFERVAKFLDGNAKYGYYIKEISITNKK